MGCGYATCAITRLPIVWDKVVMVEFNENPFERALKWETCFIETHNLSIRRILKGTYNEYGYLEEYEVKDDDDRLNTFRIFILEDVWNKVAKEYAITVDEEILALYKKYVRGSKFPTIGISTNLMFVDKDPHLYEEYNSLPEETKDKIDALQWRTYLGEFGDELQAILNFMDCARINLDTWYNGYTQMMDFEAHEFHQEISRQSLEKKKKDWDEEL